MPPTPTLNVSLTPQLERFIARLVASGRYQTASEVVRAGLRLLEKFEAADLSATLAGLVGQPVEGQPDGRSAGAQLRRHA